MSDLGTILGGVAGVALLYFGAEALVRGGVAVARFAHVPKLIIGLTLVAFGTSAPELVVSIDAAWKNSGDIAIGNVVGSNICNIALILGLSAVISPLPGDKSLRRIDLPFLVATTLLFTGLALGNGGIGRWSGGAMLALLIAYMLIRIKLFPGELEQNAETSEARLSPVRGIVYALGGLLGLIIGARLFVNGAICLAQLAGVSEAVIALSVVALGTSLPELATSTVAAFRGETDIAVGNVVGSNLFNILCIMGIAPLIRPVATSGVGVVDFGLMTGLTLFLALLMLLIDRLPRWSGGALLAIYALYAVRLFICG